jgi:hypothetical protein
MTRDELTTSIQQHLSQQGKQRMTNLQLAKLDKLREIATSYQLPITKPKEANKTNNEENNYYKRNINVDDIVYVYHSYELENRYVFYKIVSFTPKKLIRAVKLPCKFTCVENIANDRSKYTYVPDTSYVIEKDDKLEVIRTNNIGIFNNEKEYEFTIYSR